LRGRQRGMTPFDFTVWRFANSPCRTVAGPAITVVALLTVFGIQGIRN
jgi:hypothetical protein